MTRPDISAKGGKGISEVAAPLTSASRQLRSETATAQPAARVELRRLLDVLDHLLEGFGEGKLNDVRGALETLEREQWPATVEDAIRRARTALAPYI